MLQINCVEIVNFGKMASKVEMNGFKQKKAGIEVQRGMNGKMLWFAVCQEGCGCLIKDSNKTLVKELTYEHVRTTKHCVGLGMVYVVDKK